MVDALIRWSLANRLAVLVAAGVLVGVGAYVTTTVPVDVFPDLTAPTVTVLIEGHGMAPVEMETLVTFPIETAVNGATGVRRVRSATAVGLSVVWIEFAWGTEIHKARQTVAERLSAVTSRLPPQVGPPLLAPISSIMGEILFVSLTSETHSPLELRTVAGWDVRRRLLSVPGVSQVTPIGGDMKQYQVVLSPQRLRAYGIQPDAVRAALAEANENVSAGILVGGGEEAILQGIGRITGLDDIRETVVAMRDGKPIRIRDLGVARIGAALKRGTAASARRGPDWAPIIEEGVVLGIQKQPGVNTLALTERLEKTLDDIQASLPAGMRINRNLFRQASFIEASIDNMVEALRDGSIMVILVVVVFLASFRASLITLLAIPTSLLLSLIALKQIGVTINTMTLGGMSIAIGMLIDDALIDVENIIRRLRENARRPEDQRLPAGRVIYAASVEVRASIVFATAIILLVFLPVFFLPGVGGRLLRPLGWAFTISLAASLLVALTLTPALASYLLPSAPAVRARNEAWVIRVSKRWYARVLDPALRHPWLVVTPTVLLLALSGFGVARTGWSFLPEFNEGALVVGLVSVPGTSLEQSSRLAHIVEETLMAHPEIVAIGRRTGRGEQDEHVQGVEASEIDLTLDMDAPLRLGKPKRTKAQLLAALRQDLAAVAGVQATFGQPISHRIDHMLSGTRAAIAVKIFGPDLRTLRTLAAQVEAAMADVPGIVDLSVEPQTVIPLVRVEFDREAMARYGLHIADAARALEFAFQGVTVTQVVEGRSTFDLVVRVGEAAAADSWTKAPPEAVEGVLVDTPGGFQVPLRTIATVSRERGPNRISREDTSRKIVIQCNVAGGDLGSVVGQIKAAVAEHVALPPGYRIAYGGQFETAEKTFRRLLLLFVAVLFGVGFLLHVAFRSLGDALLVMVNLPLALIGGVAGVYVAGGVTSVASIIGFISVFGIAVRNGILMVSHIRHLQQREGVTDLRQAVRQGAMERLAPILMTALTAGCALIPLALGAGEPGKEILAPMATVILFGLLSSTFLNMVVVPTLFLHLARPTTAPPPRERGFS